MNFLVREDLDEVDLSKLHISDIPQLQPSTDFESIRRRLKSENLRLFINPNTPATHFEQIASNTEKVTYVLLSYIPLFCVLGSSIIGVFFNYWSFASLLLLPIIRFISPITFYMRNGIYATLTLILITSLFLTLPWYVLLNVTIALLLFIFWNSKEQLKANIILRNTSKNETEFIRSFLSDRIFILRGDELLNKPIESDYIISKYIKQNPPKLNLNERLFYCKRCLNNAFDKYQGVVCSLTGKKPTFEFSCSDYQTDEPRATMENIRHVSKDVDRDKAKSSTAIALYLIDLLIVTFTIAALNYVLYDKPIPFINSGFFSLLNRQFPSISGLYFLILPIVFFILGICARLKSKHALLISAIVVIIDGFLLALFGDFTLEPHLKFALAAAIITGYSNIETVTLFSKNLGSQKVISSYLYNLEEEEGDDQKNKS